MAGFGVATEASGIKTGSRHRITYAKQKNVARAKAAPINAGDTWTWTAIDADSKLILSWLVGKRDARHAQIVIDDLKNRITHRVQITTDGLRVYADAIENAFGSDVDFAHW